MRILTIIYTINQVSIGSVSTVEDLMISDLIKVISPKGIIISANLPSNSEFIIFLRSKFIVSQKSIWF